MRIDNIEDVDFVIDTIKEEKKKEKENDKHLKGYIFDSLIFRYQVALERGFQSRVEECLGEGLPATKAKDIARRRTNDDLLRFMRVLNEAIGEHD